MAERLTVIPEVLEVHTITGVGDMLCRPVARTNVDLQRVPKRSSPPRARCAPPP